MRFCFLRGRALSRVKRGLSHGCKEGMNEEGQSMLKTFAILLGLKRVPQPPCRDAVGRLESR